MKCAFLVCLLVAVAYAADPYNQEEGKCGCCPLPCCCVCVEQTETIEQTTTPYVTGTTPPPICVSEINLAFIVDVSASIRDENLPIVKDFLIRLLNQMSGNADTKSACVSYATNATEHWRFGDPEASDIGLATAALEDFQMGRFTNLAAGIELMLDIMNTDPSFDSNIPTIVLVFSDGRSVRRERALPGLVDELKAVDNLEIGVVGVTNKTDPDELNMVCSVCPFFFAEDFDELLEQINNFVLQTCTEVETAPPPPPPTAGTITVVTGEDCFCCCPSPYMSQYGAMYYK